MADQCYNVCTLQEVDEMYKKMQASSIAHSSHVGVQCIICDLYIWVTCPASCMCMHAQGKKQRLIILI
jgi:hypothetical protein